MKRLIFLCFISLFFLGCEKQHEISRFIDKETKGLGDFVESAEGVKNSLSDRYNVLGKEIEDLKAKVIEGKNESVEKIETIKSRLEATQEAYQEVKDSLDKLNKTSSELKESLLPSSD